MANAGKTITINLNIFHINNICTTSATLSIAIFETQKKILLTINISPTTVFRNINTNGEKQPM
jgi:hypothetical protein